MSDVWLAIIVVGLAVATIKAAGPVFVGGRELQPQTRSVIALLAPALLTALVITETFGREGDIVFDERALGVATVVVALALRAPILLAVLLAACATALARLLI